MAQVFQGLEGRSSMAYYMIHRYLFKRKLSRCTVTWSLDSNQSMLNSQLIKLHQFHTTVNHSKGSITLIQLKHGETGVLISNGLEASITLILFYV